MIPRRGHSEQASAEYELVGAMAVGQEAVVTNAMEAIRQYVEEEAAHELGDRHSHDFALMTATLPVVLPAEADVGLVKVEQATVGDSDTVGVARQIGQELLGTGEGLFRIDDPFGCAQRRESGGKCLRPIERCEIGKELQFAGLERCRQTFEEKATRRSAAAARRRRQVRVALPGGARRSAPPDTRAREMRAIKIYAESNRPNSKFP